MELITDEQKIVQLEACERRIMSGFRRGLEATSDIGKELLTIETNELYEAAGFQSLATYAQHRLLMDNAAVSRCKTVFRAIEQLKSGGLKELPFNETQVLQLAKLPAERMVHVWVQLVDDFERNEKEITAADVRDAVKRETEIEKPKPGVKAGIKIDEPLSETGERALAKIKRVCGEDVAEAIKSGARQLSEQAITRWAELDDNRMKDLIYYVIDQAWTVKQAIDYEERTIGGDSTLDELTLRARARSGLHIKHEEFLVTFALG